MATILIIVHHPPRFHVKNVHLLSTVSFCFFRVLIRQNDSHWASEGLYTDKIHISLYVKYTFYSLRPGGTKRANQHLDKPTTSVCVQTVLGSCGPCISAAQ